MFTNIFAVSKKHDILAIFTHVSKRIQKDLRDLFTLFFHSYLSHRNNIWNPDEISAKCNARVAGIFRPTLYVISRTISQQEQRRSTHVFCHKSVVLNFLGSVHILCRVLTVLSYIRFYFTIYSSPSKNVFRNF